MHHSDDPKMSRELARELRKQFEGAGAGPEIFEQLKPLGPTGKFPEGKLHETDEGEIRLGVTVKDGKVILDFGSPVVWVGFDAKQARDLSRLLRERAKEAEETR